MKKKSILGRVGIVAAALTLATTSLMSGTLARYQTTADVYAAGVVARWDARVTDSKDKKIEAEIDLASLMNPNAEGNEVDYNKIGSTAKKMDRIAPGTKGKTQIKVNLAGSEVPVLMTMKATLKGKDGKTYVMPDHIKVQVIDDATGSVVGTLNNNYNNEEGVWESAFDTENGEAVLIGVGSKKLPLLFNSARESGVQVKTYTLKWEWPLDTDGSTDKNAAEYNKNDLTYASKEATTARTFGFHLDILLSQASAEDLQEGENVGYKLVVS